MIWHYRNWPARSSLWGKWFIGPAIGPNKFKKLTRLLAAAHNIHGKVWMKNRWLHRQTVYCLWSTYAVFHSNFTRYIVCHYYKPCRFPRFACTVCWSNRSYYSITSPANWGSAWAVDGPSELGVIWVLEWVSSLVNRTYWFYQSWMR